jgi:V8-like Glu-specific endopeptidase
MRESPDFRRGEMSNVKKTIFSISLIFAILFSFSAPSYALPETNEPEDNTAIFFDYATKKQTIIDLGTIETQSANFTAATHDIGAYSPSDSFETQNLTFNYQVDPSLDPWKKIVLLRMGFDYDHNGTEDDITYGSGFMVAGDVLLTAGHCIWHTQYDVPATTVRIYRNYASATALTVASGFEPSSWIVPSQFAKSGINDPEYDWAVIKLQNHLQTTGWFSYSNDTNISDKLIATGGYPSDPNIRHFQYGGYGTANTVSARQLTHDAYCIGGMSGGPIFDSNGVAWGIQTYTGATENYGSLITTQVVNAINTVINDPGSNEKVSWRVLGFV